MSLWGWLRGQFISLPVPDEDCSGRTIIVTGANVGLGREAARHFVRLGATKVIIACRSIESGEKARQDIERSTQLQDVIEVWQLDLSSSASVREFAARVNELDRVDVLLNNASVLTFQKEVVEGHELQLLVNVIYTFLISILVLPSLRRTAAKFNVTPHLSFVASDGAFLANFPKASSDRIFQQLDADPSVMQRYSLTKLLQLMAMKRLGEAVDESGKGHVLVNALSPGLCRTELYRNWSFPFNMAVKLVNVLLGRTAEMGSRTLVAAALAGEETHANWMSDCRLYVWPGSMEGDEGEKLTSRVWDELVVILEGVEPNLRSMI
ncbi:hypothetical protein AK830_g4882 [Neonectria ditissima]|uniref:Uncharacterized protein n=1 Tax=Neonectria ditissima TaxID=78410 RepID=A0A0P7BM13_9HYPO|nr:hypothetical protein AK830_g4882 [Neonectria ditissima]